MPKRRKNRQTNVELTQRRHNALMELASQTDSKSTSGTNIGQPSIGALMRRISEGKITLIYQGEKKYLSLKDFL